MFLKKKISAAIFAVLAMISAAANAEKDFYVAPFGSYLHSDANTNGLDGFGAGMAFGKEINAHFNVEIRGFWQKYDNDYSCCNNKPNVNVRGDSELTGGTLDLQWFWWRETFSPYVVAAVGAMNTDFNMQSTVFGKTANYGKETTSFIFESGIGATYKVSDYFSLRSDVRYRLNTFPLNAGSKNDSIFNDLTVNFGFLVPFGS